MYTPDKWLIVKINGKDPHYRVFATWYGGYLNGDSWRMNSGITKVSEDGDYYVIEGSSGSQYFCHKKARGISGYGSGVLGNIISNQPDLDIQILSEDVTITELEFT